MVLQPVKVFHPDDKGILRLVRVISESDILKLAEEKNSKKTNWNNPKNENIGDKSRDITKVSEEISINLSWR